MSMTHSGWPRVAVSVRKLVLVSAVLLFGAAACPACPEDGTADLRVIHLSPDAPAVDVWQRDPNTRLFSNLSFTDGTTYLMVDEGTYTLEVTPAGAAIGESVLTLDDLELSEDRIYTAVVIGRLDDLRGLMLEDDLTIPPANQIRVRVVHAAPGIGEVDIWNVTDPETPAPLVENISFGEASGRLVIDAGTYVVGLDVNGDEQPEVVFELPELTAGTVLNLFAIEDQAGEPFLLAQLIDGTTVRIEPRPIVPELEEDQAGVRFVHLSPDAPPVDIWGPDATVVTALAFADGTLHLPVPVDIDLVEIVPAGQEREEAVLTVVPPDLVAGEYYTVVVFGELAEVAVLFLLDDQTATIPGAVRIRPVHVAVGVGAVDLWAARPNQPPILAFEDLGYGEAAEAIEVPAGNYSIGLDVGRDGLIDVTASLGPITAATIANIFAAVGMEGEVFFLVQENGRYTRIDATIEDPPLAPGDVLPLGE